MSKNVQPKIDSDKEPMIAEIPITKAADRRQSDADETTGLVTKTLFPLLHRKTFISGVAIIVDLHVTVIHSATPS